MAFSCFFVQARTGGAASSTLTYACTLPTSPAFSLMVGFGCRRITIHKYEHYFPKQGKLKPMSVSVSVCQSLVGFLTLARRRTNVPVLPPERQEWGGVGWNCEVSVLPSCSFPFSFSPSLSLPAWCLFLHGLAVMSQRLDA